MLHIPTSMCGIFTCPNIGKAASVWDFLGALRCWCVQGCVDTTKESALKVDAGTLRNKSLVTWENKTCISIVPSMAFQSDAPPTELSCPWVDFFVVVFNLFFELSENYMQFNQEWGMGSWRFWTVWNLSVTCWGVTDNREWQKSRCHNTRDATMVLVASPLRTYV